MTANVNAKITGVFINIQGGLVSKGKRVYLSIYKAGWFQKVTLPSVDYFENYFPCAANRSHMLATKTSSENIAIIKIDFHQAKITIKATSTKYTTVNSPRKIKYSNRTGIDLRLHSLLNKIYTFFYSRLLDQLLCVQLPNLIVIGSK